MCSCTRRPSFYSWYLNTVQNNQSQYLQQQLVCVCVCVCVTVCACTCLFVWMFVFAYFYLSLWPAFVVATLAHALVIEYLHGNSDVILHHWLTKQHSSIKSIQYSLLPDTPCDELVMVMNSLCFRRACPDFLMDGDEFMHIQLALAGLCSLSCVFFRAMNCDLYPQVNITLTSQTIQVNGGWGVSWTFWLLWSSTEQLWYLALNNCEFYVRKSQREGQ